MSGDRIIEVPRGSRVLFAVIDGLGHGPEAADAANAAAGFLAEHASLPLESLLRDCDRAIADTRGAAITIIRIATASAELEHAAVGNVELVARSREPIRPITRPGIVGARFRKVVASVHAVHPGDRFVVCTDGVSSRFRLDGLEGVAPQGVAQRIIEHYGQSHDDASCLVVDVS